MKSSGLLDLLQKTYENENNCTLKIQSLGTGAALRLGRTGAVDVLLVHSPAAEIKFVSGGYGVKRIPVMQNDFLLVGPAHDPANIKSATSVSDALRRIFKTKSLFLSRGDDSGTHKKELHLWRSARLTPFGSWYFESGVSMGKLLSQSEEKQGYLLIDRGTWLWSHEQSTLLALFEGGDDLINPYSIIAVKPTLENGINTISANTFIKWITSDRIQALIANYKIKDQQLFHPAKQQE